MHIFFFLSPTLSVGGWKPAYGMCFGKSAFVEFHNFSSEIRTLNRKQNTYFCLFIHDALYLMCCSNNDYNTEYNANKQKFCTVFFRLLLLFNATNKLLSLYLLWLFWTSSTSSLLLWWYSWMLMHATPTHVMLFIYDILFDREYKYLRISSSCTFVVSFTLRRAEKQQKILSHRWRLW